MLEAATPIDAEFTKVAILLVGRLSMEGPTLGIHPAIAARNLSLRHHLA